NENRMLARSQNIRAVKIRSRQSVKQRHVAASPPVKTRYLFAGTTTLRRDKFLPAIIPAIQNSQRAERRGEAAPVEPAQQILKVRVQGLRLGFINHLDPGTAFQNPYCPPASVAVARVTLNANQWARI